MAVDRAVEGRRSARRTGARRYGGHVPAPAGVLVDIDGVLTTSWVALPGAVEALSRLRAMGLAVAFPTNTTSRTRAQVAAALVEAGFAVAAEEVITTAAVTATYLHRHHPGARVALLTSGDLTDDLPGVTLVADDASDGDADVLVLGGAGPEMGYAALNRAFRLLLAGVPALAMNGNVAWRTAEGMQLDTGAYVAALEAASGATIEVVGKPAAAFFEAGLDHLGVSAAQAWMVGDDVASDVLGAQACGLTGVLVRTGKYDPAAVARAVERAGRTPDLVAGSFADVPDLVEQASGGSGANI